MAQRLTFPLACFLIVATAALPAQVIEKKKVHEETTLVYPPARHAPIHKAGAVQLMAFMALLGRTDIRPSDPQGLAAVRLKSTDDPLNRSDDDDLTVYGLNSGQHNIIFNSSMLTLDVYEGKGPRQKLKHPKGIAGDPAGNVYVADTGHNRVVKLHNPGNHLTFVRAAGQEGSQTGQFREPTGIAVGPSGRVYVCDYGNDRVQVMDGDLSPMYAIGNRSDSSVAMAQFFRPYAIALSETGDSNSYYQEDFLVVVDLNNSRIQKLTSDGRFIRGISSTEYGYQRVFLTSVALDYFGSVWVTDLFNHCIHKFDHDLNYITSFGHIGEGDGEFFEPRSIAIGKRFGQVFIADKNFAQYYHIGTDVLNFNISMKDTILHFDFFLTEYSKVSARIVNEEGVLVAKLCTNRLMTLGRQSLQWDRRRTSRITQPLRKAVDSLETMREPILASEFMPSGLYKIIVEARTTYPYSRYFTKTIEVEFAY